MTIADELARVWFRHPVVIRPRAVMTATGPRAGDPVEVLASISAQARTVTNQHGEETVAAATLHWHVDGPLPKPGETVDLPEVFGLAPGREIITARRADSGTGATPAHVEVTVQ